MLISRKGKREKPEFLLPGTPDPRLQELTQKDLERFSRTAVRQREREPERGCRLQLLSWPDNGGYHSEQQKNPIVPHRSYFAPITNTPQVLRPEPAPMEVRGLCCLATANFMFACKINYPEPGVLVVKALGAAPRSTAECTNLVYCHSLQGLPFRRFIYRHR